MLSEEQVKHVAALARLDLSDVEAKKFSGQLSDILSYMEILNEVDTENVAATSQVTGLENVSRKDEVKKWCERDELLACTELPIENNQIKVKPVITFN
jgi:aspartyl-tRNA(Asn)/glutamyl-tRNA(Gln) amidotransferase subunit C